MAIRNPRKSIISHMVETSKVHFYTERFCNGKICDIYTLSVLA